MTSLTVSLWQIVLLILFPEEICTLVIAESFPEDAGIFTCSARNDYGSVTSTAQLLVTSGTWAPKAPGSSYSVFVQVVPQDRQQLSQGQSSAPRNVRDPSKGLLTIECLILEARSCGGGDDEQGN